MRRDARRDRTRGREPLLYAAQGHLLYYCLLLAWSAATSENLDASIGLMNHAAWVASAGNLGLLYLFLRRPVATEHTA